MDRKALALGVAVALLAAGAYAHLAFVAATKSSPPSVEPAASAADRADGDVTARLGRIEEGIRELRALREEVASMRAAVDRLAERAKAGTSLGASTDATLRSAAAPGVAAAGAPPPAHADAAKDDPYPTLSNEDLRIEALAASRPGESKDVSGSIRRWKALLGRTLPKDQREEALLQLGYAWFGLHENAKAEESLRALEESAGPDTKNGVEAQRMLGWTRLGSGDYRGALEAAQRVVASRTAERNVVANARWIGAIALGNLHEDANAKRELQGLVDDYGSDAALKWMVDAAKQRLETMK
jgi:hypothetical protein